MVICKCQNVYFNASHKIKPLLLAMQSKKSRVRVLYLCERVHVSAIQSFESMHLSFESAGKIAFLIIKQ